MDRKSFIKKYIAIFIVAIIGVVILSIMVKYSVEGETNVPFKISKIMIISTAGGTEKEESTTKWNLKLLQSNDIYIDIIKNKNYSEEEIIDKIIIDNFKIERKPIQGNVNIYKPNTGIFNNKEEYKVEERIGGGGFSSVFKIKKIDDGEYYALKTFSSDFADKIELETFKNEISKSMQVESKNTVKYLFFNDGEIFSDLPPYIIMEYCNGGTLEGYMEDIKNSENVITNEELKKI